MESLLNHIKIPGKTFLVGEYSVLVGGEALVLATQPCFLWNEDGQQKTMFHVDSAAGKYLYKNTGSCEINGSLINPYKVGGFGASTAEFIASYLSVNLRLSRELKDIKISDIFQSYQDLYFNDLRRRPSGADLIGQLVGGVTHFKKQNINSDDNKADLFYGALDWRFEDLEFLLYSTGLKVKTHEHLDTLDRKHCDALLPLASNCVQIFKSGKDDLFVEALDVWSKKLAELGFLAQPTAELRNYLNSKIAHNVSRFLVKPCGALGADVILVLCRQTERQFVQSEIDKLNISGLKYIADSKSLVKGALYSN